MRTGYYSHVVATIPNGQALSDAVPLGGAEMTGLLMPAAWTAAGLTFQGSLDGVNYFEISLDTGAPTAATVPSAAAAAGALLVRGAAGTSALAQILGIPFIKVRSGTSGAPVNQAAERQIKILTWVAF